MMSVSILMVIAIIVTIKEKGLSADDVYDRATRRRMSSYIDPT